MTEPHLCILAPVRSGTVRRRWPGRVAGLCLAWMLAATAQAQTADLPPLRPLSMVSAEAALARLPGAPTPAPRTSGTLDLRGKQVHIAEYLVLFDLRASSPARCATAGCWACRCPRARRS